VNADTAFSTPVIPEGNDGTVSLFHVFSYSKAQSQHDDCILVVLLSVAAGC
jgi:hypothetical protein